MSTFVLHIKELPAILRMKQLLAIILLLIPIITCSQNNDFSEVDNYVDSLKVDKDISISDLTRKLTMPFSSDLLKVRALFFWLASNIEYDYKDNETSLWTNYPSVKEKLNDTYKFRKGVCSGYSHLFKYMLRLSGIKSKVISGYARNDLKSCFPQNPNHAWNSVKIENKWYLFDVTWARDTLKKVNDFWFKTDPDIFILNHYPLYEPYTFTKKQYSFEDFYQFPIYTSSFYDLKFTNDISKIGHFNAVNDTVTININPNFKCLLLTKLYDIHNKKWIPAQPGGFVSGADYFKLYIPKKGDFVLKLGALKQNDNSFVIYDELVFYTIENK
jgi:transglutaminase/protease-like cytokinesis protein 3